MRAVSAGPKEPGCPGEEGLCWTLRVGWPTGRCGTRWEWELGGDGFWHRISCSHTFQRRNELSGHEFPGLFFSFSVFDVL